MSDAPTLRPKKAAKPKPRTPNRDELFALIEDARLAELIYTRAGRDEEDEERFAFLRASRKQWDALDSLLLRAESAERELREAAWKAHVPCTSEMHDPSNGLIHGYCVRCRTIWPCEYSPESRAILEDATNG